MPLSIARPCDWSFAKRAVRGTCQNLIWQALMAESAGVEPARPEGLAALAPRCLAARPTLRLSKWSPRRDSNAQPEASDASALVH